MQEQLWAVGGSLLSEEFTEEQSIAFQWQCISVPETTRTGGSCAEVAEEPETVELTLWVFRGHVITGVCVRVGSVASLRSVKGGAAAPAR